ncbi:unnamed protein product [Sphagnum balticum]
MQEARSLTDTQEVGETNEAGMARFLKIIEEAVQANYEKGVKGKYYIHIWLQKEPYANNTLHIYPQCRRSRPSPYQGHDHYLWSVEDGGKVTFEWCIPSKEVLTHILNHPHEFDVNYVRMLKKYCKDQLEKPEDYLIDGKLT